MSETWNGITLAEIRTSRLQRLSGTIRAVKRLIDLSQNVDYTFDTSTDGAVIVSNNYMTWEFIAPENYTVAVGTTVGTEISNLESATTANPVTAWDDFASFLNGKRSVINMYLTEGESAIIRDAQGNTYPGTQHLLSQISDFPDLCRWLATWGSQAFFTANSSVIFSATNTLHFSLTADSITIDVTIKL